MANEKKYPLTQRLIQTARNDGKDREEIANLCGVKPGTVGGWERGDRDGTYKQLKPLIDLYGEKVERSSKTVYRAVGKDSQKTFVVSGAILFKYSFYYEEKEKQKQKKYLRVVIHSTGSSIVFVVQKKLDAESELERGMWSSTPFVFADSKTLLTFLDGIKVWTGVATKDIHHSLFRITGTIESYFLERNRGLLDFGNKTVLECRKSSSKTVLEQLDGYVAYQKKIVNILDGIQTSISSLSQTLSNGLCHQKCLHEHEMVNLMSIKDHIEKNDLEEVAELSFFTAEKIKRISKEINLVELDLLNLFVQFVNSFNYNSRTISSEEIDTLHFLLQQTFYSNSIPVEGILRVDDIGFKIPPVE